MHKSAEAPALIPATVYAVDLEARDVIDRDGVKFEIVTVGRPRAGATGFTTVSVKAERVDMPGHVIRCGFLAVDTVDVLRAAPAGLGR